MNSMDHRHSLSCANCGKTVSGTMFQDGVWFVQPDLRVESKSVFWCITKEFEDRLACLQRCARSLIEVFREDEENSEDDEDEEEEEDREPD
eukprot:1398162-Rhodomonas_salina.1